LLKREYRDRLNTIVFIKAYTFFEDEHKARSFLAISNKEKQDRFLGFAEEGTDLLLGVILLGIVARNYLMRTKDENEMAS
jgi:hypothetical protein